MRGKEGMRYLADFFWRGGGWVLTECLQGLIQATRFTVLDVTEAAFRAQILRDVPPKVAIFDTC